AKDNETQILAGLINRIGEDNKSGLPGLSQLPLLDRLFGSREGNNSKSELVLVITPRIERKLELPGAHVTTFISGTESRVSQDSLILRNTEGARLTAGGGTASVSTPQVEEQTRREEKETEELPDLELPIDQGVPVDKGVPASVPPPLRPNTVGYSQPAANPQSLAKATVAGMSSYLANRELKPDLT
ncbi:hypothetical protein QN360_20885, partial [Glaciimonas sp. CA11.2]|nr:hypothetical protein [Glaciimonas sp. CA11.2]